MRIGVIWFFGRSLAYRLGHDGGGQQVQVV
jgi:hypothetical protein